MLGSTCLAHEIAPEKTMRFVDGGNREEAVQWSKRIRRSLLDPIKKLTDELDRLLCETARVPHNVCEDLVADLEELRQWRNALCHGAWLAVDADGCGHLEHLIPFEGLPAAFEPRTMTPEDLSYIRTKTVDLTLRIAEAASISGPPDICVAGGGYTSALELPRRSGPFEL